MTGQFSFEENPGDAADETAEALMELHELMAKSGQGAWTRGQITVNREGKLDTSFSYDE